MTCDGSGWIWYRTLAPDWAEFDRDVREPCPGCDACKPKPRFREFVSLPKRRHDWVTIGTDNEMRRVMRCWRCKAEIRLSFGGPLLSDEDRATFESGCTPLVEIAT